MANTIGKTMTPDNQKSGPSGATDKPVERIKKFDEEGGDQPQAQSQRQADEELAKARETEAKARPKQP